MMTLEGASSSSTTRAQPEPMLAELLEIGSVLDARYRIIRAIGRGGMGEVYEGRQLPLDRRVAIKVLRPQAEASAAARMRFKREACAMARIESEHVATIFDFGHATEARPYLVMEYLEGRDLRALLKEHRRVPAPRAARLLHGVCRGLEAAHRQGVLHRDLKPENLFVVTRDGMEKCKVLDFGLAKLLHSSRSDLPTQAGIPLGTLHYMSPEQARGDPDIDERADVYGCAAVLYELLTGKRPHAAQSAHGLLYKIIHEDPTRADRVSADVPAPLAEIVQWGLARARRERAVSIADFAAALAPFSGSSTPSASHFHGHGAETLSNSGATSLAPRPGKDRLGAGVAGALALLAGGVLAFVSSGTSLAPRPSPPSWTVPPVPGAPLAGTAAAALALVAARSEPRSDAAPTSGDANPPRPLPASAAPPKEVRSHDARAQPRATSTFERRNPYE